MKARKRTGITKNRKNAVAVGSHTATVVHRDHLLTLATATTAYHEAPPDRAEEARVAYEQALKMFQEHTAVAECTR